MMLKYAVNGVFYDSADEVIEMMESEGFDMDAQTYTNMLLLRVNEEMDIAPGVTVAIRGVWE